MTDPFPVGSWVRWVDPIAGDYGHGRIPSGTIGFVVPRDRKRVGFVYAHFRNTSGPVFALPERIVQARPTEEEIAWRIEQVLSQ